MSKKEPYIPIKKNAHPVLDEQDRQKKFEFTHQEVCCMTAHLGVGEKLLNMMNPEGTAVDTKRLKKETISCMEACLCCPYMKDCFAPERAEEPTFWFFFKYRLESAVLNINQCKRDNPVKIADTKKVA